MLKEIKCIESIDKLFSPEWSFKGYNRRNKTLKVKKLSERIIEKNGEQILDKIDLTGPMHIKDKELTEEKIYEAIHSLFKSGKKRDAGALFGDVFKVRKDIDIEKSLFIKIKNYIDDRNIEDKKFNEMEDLLDICFENKFFKNPKFLNLYKDAIKKYIECEKFNEAYKLAMKGCENKVWKVSDFMKYFKGKLRVSEYIKEQFITKIRSDIECDINAKKWKEANEKYLFFCSISKDFEVILNDYLIKKIKGFKKDEKGFLEMMRDFVNKMKLSKSFHKKFLSFMKERCDYLSDLAEGKKSNSILTYINNKVMKMERIVESYFDCDEVEKAKKLSKRWCSIDKKHENYFKIKDIKNDFIRGNLSKIKEDVKKSSDKDLIQLVDSFAKRKKWAIVSKMLLYADQLDAKKRSYYFIQSVKGLQGFSKDLLELYNRAVVQIKTDRNEIIQVERIKKEIFKYFKKDREKLKKLEKCMNYGFEKVTDLEKI
jgi:hypothetical protein